MELKQAFGMALKARRLDRKLTQEDFSDVSSRTYLSTLERGQKCPTLEKVAELASVLQVHPLTLIAESFLALEPGQTLEALLEVVQREAQPA
ncbi:helix-turn-helix transcriptional regulator [Pseudomonas koreensis]|uniref:helix-turn-helix domain-containing protein n=1 Tax=Pseudomonas koreensis TaxID=198620 RepID=UPI0015754837|nr:helix-turn-helix transcriptional regulator [Pseudomonas koreensis]NTZ94184.1 helix-turn-helix transcriptional regulator [Pseudomonas koreensis]